MQSGDAIEIARRGFAGVIGKFRGDALPLLEAPFEPNRFRRRSAGQRGSSFESANVSHELPIVVVTVTSLHWFDITAELLVELIHEHERTIRATPASGNPFVPAGDHYEGGMQVEGSLPLLLKIKSAIDRT